MSDEVALNKGRTSPRFAFMERFTIPDRKTDAAYLYRLRLFDCKWFGLYMHVIAAPDPDEYLHNHPAGFHALILSGSYREEYLPPGLHRHDLARYTRDHKHFSINHIRYGAFHRIVSCDGPVWTLVLRGRRRSSWGFLVDGKEMPYEEYLDPEKWDDGVRLNGSSN